MSPCTTILPAEIIVDAETDPVLPATDCTGAADAGSADAGAASYRSEASRADAAADPRTTQCWSAAADADY